MIIIVESGATKTDWCAIRDDGSVKTLRSDGVNVSVMPSGGIDHTSSKAVMALNPDKEYIKEMHFYVAGLIESRTTGNVEYVSDLLGAARAACGHNPGITAILGTGSNSCFYDGQSIVRNIRSGGYILGDEGSAAHLGLRFLSDFLKEMVPSEVSDAFKEKYESDYQTIIKNIYKADAPSKYLGSFAPWIMEWYGKNEYVTELAESNFRSFIERSLLRYDIDKYPVGLVGGFAFANQEIFSRVASSYGVRISQVMEAPMEGLIRYHSNG